MIYLGMKAIDKGGGVLLLLALFPGILTLVCLNFLLSSVGRESYFHKPIEGKIQDNLADIEKMENQYRDTIAKGSKERSRFWISSARRRQLDFEISNAEFMLAKLQKLKKNVQDESFYAKDEP